jgi:hypothetical protein
MPRLMSWRGIIFVLTELHSYMSLRGAPASLTSSPEPGRKRRSSALGIPLMGGISRFWIPLGGGILDSGTIYPRMDCFANSARNDTILAVIVR